MRIRLNIIVWILLFVPGFVVAQFTPESFSKLNYATAIPPATLRLDTVADGNYFVDLVAPGSNWRTRYKHNKVKDYITIAVKDTSIAIAQYDYIFNITVNRYDVNGTLATFTINMRMSYDPAQYKPYRDVAVYQFSGAHRFVCTINSVKDAGTGSTIAWASVKKNFTIEEKINVERYYLNSYETAISTSNITTAVTPGKIRVDWTKDTAIKGPLQYELEWLFADNYTAGYPEYVKDYTVAQQLYTDSTGTLGWFPSDSVTWGINRGYLYFITHPLAVKNKNLNNTIGFTTIVGHTYRIIVNVKYMTAGDTFHVIQYPRKNSPPVPGNKDSILLGAGIRNLTFVADSVVTLYAIAGSSPGTYMIDDITLVDITWPGPPPSGGVYTKPDSLMAYDFINNATRIRTSGKSYIIENVFEKGNLLYRLRRVRPDSVFFAYEKFSTWAPSLADSGNVKSWTQKIAISTPHTGDTLNWNYQVNYIEEGKRKDVTSYYDGLLKPRQQVAVSNTDTMVIVGESKYDFQGRPTVQILPAPALKVNGTSGNYYEKDMKFYYNFNRNLSGTPYSASQFDSTVNVCPTDTSRSLFNQSGASRYYSTNNPDTNNAQKFVPQGEGYPMTEVEYMPDNSGRVKRQSGAGKSLQIGTGRETMYYYERLEQPEIDRVFGSEAGNASHYKKVGVKDANGQMSVKYVDVQGRTIATALVDGNPVNLDVLPNNRPANLLYTELTRYNDPDVRTDVELSYDLNLFRQGPVYIDYRMQTSNFRNACMPVNLCFKCVYNYEISLVNTECNQVVFSYKDTIGLLNPADTVCGVLTTYKLANKRYALNALNSQVDTTNLDSFIRVLNLASGSYTLRKRLSINPGAYDTFYNIYQQKATCVKTFDSFFSDALSQTDFSGCNGCDSCSTNAADYCSSMLGIMKMDVSPGGQYFTYGIDVNGNYTAGSDTSSVLASNKYKIRVNGYRENGVNSLVPDPVTGSMVAPTSTNVDVNTFVKYFKSDWADTLVTLHPEYCFYRYCRDSLASSYRYDFRFNTIDDYDTAFAKGYMNPTGVTGLKYNFPFVTAGKDSLFTNRPGVLAHMNYRLMNFKVIRGKMYTAWDIAAVEAFCGSTTTDQQQMYACLEAFANQKVIDSVFYDTAYTNNFLRAFRAMYASAKSQVIDSLMRNAPTGCALAPPCYVGQSCNATYQNKQRRYYFGYSDGLNHNQPDTLVGLDMATQVNNSLNADSMCIIKVQKWMDALGNCPYLTQAKKDSIKTELLYVCKRGKLDTSPPAGLSVGSVPASDVSATFHTVDEVLKLHLGANYTTKYCNSSLLENAYSYDHNYYEQNARNCGCVGEGRVMPPVKVTSPGSGPWCLKDTTEWTPFALGLTAFLTEMATHNALTSSFDASTYSSYMTYIKGVMPYETVRAQTVYRPYYGSLASKSLYQWQINFTDDTVNTKRCNLFLKLADGAQQTLVNSAPSFTSFSNLTIYRSDSFSIKIITNPGNPMDPIANPVLYGKSSCYPLTLTRCLVMQTDTLYGKKVYVDTAALGTFSVKAKQMRTGLADTALAKYLAGGICGPGSGYGSSSCVSRDISPLTIGLVNALNEGLYQTRVTPSLVFNSLTKDTFNGTADGFGCRNEYFPVLSPTYENTFAINWDLYDGYRGLNWNSVDISPVDGYDDDNIFKDPYYIGTSYFGIDGCDPRVTTVNCALTFGYPAKATGASLNFNELDSFYNFRFDTTLQLPVVTGRKSGGGTFTLTVRSCYDIPFCGDFTHTADGHYSRAYSVLNDNDTSHPMKFKYTCYEPNRMDEEDHDFSYSPTYSHFGALPQFVAGYIKTIIGTLADASRLISPTPYNLGGAGAPSVVSAVIDTFNYQSDLVKDSLLIGYLGNPNSINGGCQLALRLIDATGGTFSFTSLTAADIISIRPDDNKLTEYWKKGEFEKGKHFFLLTVKKSGNIYHLRGWFSCLPVYDCVEVDETVPTSDGRCACATCPEVKNAVDSFQRKYTDLQYNDPSYKKMLANFLNNQLNNNLTPTEYEDFMQNCNMFVNDTFKVAYADLSINGTLSASCLAEIDTIIKQINDTFAYVIKYQKWKSATSSNYEVYFDLSDLPVADRVTFTYKVRDSIAAASSTCSGYVATLSYTPSCDIWVDFSRAGTDSSACYGTFASKYNTVVATRFGVPTLPSPTEYRSYVPFDTAVNRFVHHYCLSYTSKTTSQKTDIYTVIDSLLSTCTYVSYGSTFLIKPSGTTFENKTICIQQFDTNYIAYQRMECETCKDIYDKVVNYQNYIYKYRPQYIREGSLTDNIETGLFNRYGFNLQVYDQAAGMMSVCALSPQALGYARLFQHMETIGKLYLGTSLAGDTFMLNSLLNPFSYPTATYTPLTIVTTPQLVEFRITINLGPGVITFSMLGDTTIQHIDTIFRMESVSGAPNSFLLIAGSRGQTYTYYGTMTNTFPNVFGSFEISSCCSLPKPLLCFKPFTDAILADTGDCRARLTELARANAYGAWEQYTDSVKTAYKQTYQRACLDSSILKEKANLGKEFSEYQFTLYYYDVSGNLVKTVPPAGTDTLLITAALGLQLDNNRKNYQTGTHVFTKHKLTTRYKYNTQGQVVYQNTPDADSTKFYYDAAGRLVLSQNMKQMALGNVFSYTIRDGLNRTVEVGEYTGVALNSDSLKFNYSQYYLNWLKRGTKRQITRTTYDTTFSATVNNLFPGGQQNLRARVSTVAYNEYDLPQYTYATHYTYDIHGNVNVLVQEYPELGPLGNRYKYLYYTYDLISGKVNTVSYQPGQPDRFYHRYVYDADNRLIDVNTSSDSVIWDNDASYYYYKHGPLSRTELGDYRVQGVDYAYTIHGWLKGINSNTLDSTRDMGKDGAAPAALSFATDAYGFSLGYFTGDYIPMNTNYYNTAKAPIANVTGSPLAVANNNLYNGNISHMVTAVTPLMSSNKPLASIFRYDQLNRITRMETYTNINTSTNAWNSGSTAADYLNAYAYDPNGNITKLYRATSGGTIIDSLSYNYYANTNKLNWVRDNVSASVSTGDIDSQATGNYGYDKIGNLAEDKAENIDTILWNVYGKIRQIKRDAGNTKPGMEFRYDASGQRNLKIVKTGTNENRWVYTYYVRDAQGNIMATYQLKNDSNGASLYAQKLKLTEHHIYGSSRVGVRYADTTLVVRDIAISGYDSLGFYVVSSILDTTMLTVDTANSYRTLAKKQYELSDHLGNVLANVMDRHTPIGASTISKYNADIAYGQYYYPFGMTMSKFNGDTTYLGRFAFNGKERDDKDGVVEYDYGFRIYDPRIARFKSTDPLEKDYPGLTPYQFASLNPIQNIDLDGLEGAPTTGTPIIVFPQVIDQLSEMVKDASDLISQGIDNFGRNIRDVGPSTESDYDLQPTRALLNDLFYATPAGQGYQFLHPNATPEQRQQALEAITQPTGFKGQPKLKAPISSEVKAAENATTQVVLPKKGSSGGPGAGKAFGSKVKETARAESNNTCVFCGTKTTKGSGANQSNIDHAIPKSRGGNNKIENAQNTCRTCNQEKKAATTDEYIEKKKSNISGTGTRKK